MECHWGKTVRSMVKIMEKNYFAALDFRLGLALAGSLFVVVVLAILVAGLWGGTPLGIAAALSPFTLAVPGAILARRVGWPWPSALLMPIMVPVFVYALARSTWITLRQGGVRWRDTFYPLQTLKTGMVRGFGSDRK